MKGELGIGVSGKRLCKERVEPLLLSQSLKHEAVSKWAAEISEILEPIYFGGEGNERNRG